MKILGLSIVLIPTVLATSGGSDASALTNIDSPQSILGHDRDHRRKIKVTMERTVDDDSTNGYNAKTVTVERSVDDDSTDGSTISKRSSNSKSKSTANSPYEIPSDTSEKASSTTTTTSNKKHHKNSTVTDDTVSDGDDDAYSSNGTTPISDMMDVLNGNMDHDNSSDTNSFGTKGGKIVLPAEHEPSETWIVAIVTLFSSMAISLCLTTAIRRCRKNNRRTGYQEVNNIVV